MCELNCGGHAVCGETALSIDPCTYSTPALVGDGELKKAEGDDSWLVTIADKGEASREPDVVKPFIEFVMEIC